MSVEFKLEHSKYFGKLKSISLKSDVNDIRVQPKAKDYRSDSVDVHCCFQRSLLFFYFWSVPFFLTLLVRNLSCATGANVIMLCSFCPGVIAVVLRLTTNQTACLISLILQQYITGFIELLMQTIVEKMSIATFTWTVNPYFSLAIMTIEYGT